MPDQKTGPRLKYAKDGTEMKKIIKNGMLATDADVFEADILIEGDKIVAVGKDLDEGAEVIDAKGM